MKNMEFLCCAILVAASVVSCKKSEKAIQPAQIEASKKSAIQKGEPVVFTAKSNNSGSTEWLVEPSTGVQVNTGGNKASILFSKQGEYNVVAKTGSEQVSSKVSVDNDAYQGHSSMAIQELLADEKIIITVSKTDSASNTVLVFSIQTANSYTCLGNSLVTEFSRASNSFALQYTGVRKPEGCNDGQAKAGAFQWLFIESDNSSLSIIVNGKTYTGSIVRNGNIYTINWSDESKVTITPKSL